MQNQRTSFATSSRRLSRAWNNRCCASRTPFFVLDRRSFSLTLASCNAVFLPQQTALVHAHRADLRLKTCNLARRHLVHASLERK